MSEARKLLEEASQALADCKHPNAGSIKSSKCPVCALANRIDAYLASPEEAPVVQGEAVGALKREQPAPPLPRRRRRSERKGV